ncbi:hypothetical protein [uncultured Fusobacterium sp.]|uniref:hypothetical protein n=1 Tax=uncultured Fusobacterium sp. TaxID=159267 RepID=UPI0025CFC554|nr:hypothetical protein [uncultured Fusobacterium sp.]
MNQLERKEYYEEDEIDIYELVDIIIKRKILVLGIFIICSLLGLGAAFFVRSLKEDTLALKFNINYSKIESNYFFKKSGLTLTRININNILITNKYVDEFFKIKDLNNLYLEKVKEENKTDYSKSKFLNNILKVSYNNDGNNYTVSVTMKKNPELQKDILNKYIEIIKSINHTQVDDEIENRYAFIKTENISSKEKLNSIENNIKEILEKEKNFMTKDTNIKEFIEYTNPVLAVEKEKISDLYNQSAEMLIGLDGLKRDDNIKNIISLDSSVYEIETKSKAKMILVIGILFGMVPGIMSAFIAEFIDNYKKRTNTLVKK